MDHQALAKTLAEHRRMLRTRPRTPSPVALQHELADAVEDAPVPLRPGKLDPEERTASEVEQDLARAHAEFVAWTESIDVNLEALARERLRVAWRISRELCRVASRLHDDEGLDELNAFADEDPWLETLLPAIASKTPTTLSRNGQILHRLREFELGVLPPPVPLDQRDPATLEPLKSYDPIDDPTLKAWLACASRVSQNLRLHQGTTNDPMLGEKGLLHLLEPETIRLFYPSRIAIIMWEQGMVIETLHCLANHSYTQTRELLRNEHGLRDGEIEALVAQARALARKRTNSEVEDDKALMIIRLENYLERARGAFDLRNELQGLKLLSIIQGLSRTEADDAFGAMIDVVGRVANERKTLREGQGRVLDLPRATETL